MHREQLNAIHEWIDPLSFEERILWGLRVLIVWYLPIIQFAVCMPKPDMEVFICSTPIPGVHI